MDCQLRQRHLLAGDQPRIRNANFWLSITEYLAFLGAALVSQIGGYLAVGYALGYLRASLVAPTMLGQPVVTALLAIPLLGETLGMGQVIGGVAVLAGIYLVHASREKQQI